MPLPTAILCLQLTRSTEEEDEDNMEEITEENIVNRRTRGKQIDYSKAAENTEDLEDDEDDDDDFEENEDDKMME